LYTFFQSIATFILECLLQPKRICPLKQEYAELNALVCRAQATDLEAYDAIVRRFQDMAMGYAYSLLGDFHLAEDAAQEAFLGAYRNLPQLHTAAAFTSWFRQIVFNTCQQFRRRGRDREVSLEAVGEWAASSPDPAEQIEESQLQQRILQIIGALPKAEAEAITLFYISEYSQREIAEFLDTSVDTIKNRLRSGRKKLQERLLVMAKQTLSEKAPSKDDEFATVVSLCNAAQAGDLARVKKIVAAQPELARRDLAANNENQAIQFAVRGGHAAVVHVLLEAGADPLKGVYPNREATNAYTIAKERGADEIVQIIEAWLEQQRGTTSKGEEIVRAAGGGDNAQVSAMLAADPALIDATDRQGQTPLFKAIHNGNIRLVTELLDKGAAVDHTDAEGRRPIHHCLLHSWKVPDAQYKTYAVMAGILIARGAQYDHWVASGVGDVAAVEAMLQQDNQLADVYKKRDRYTRDYLNPLTVAVFQGHVDIVRLLLDQGANPDTPFDMDVAGETVPQWGQCLWVAANRNHYEVAQLLLQRGANPRTAVYASGEALEAPLLQGNKRMADLLFKYGAIGGLLSYCVANNIAAIAERMAAEPDKHDELLWGAVLAGNVEIVSRCLAANPQYDDDRWFNLMEQAVRAWRLGISRSTTTPSSGKTTSPFWACC
jgi:RNA polymerase sigma factor (sigma-70 family)